WDVESGKVVARCRQTASRISALALSPDGQLLSAGNDDGHITVWSLPHSTTVAELNDGRAGIQSLAFGRSLRRRTSDQGEVGQPWVLGSGDGGSNVTIWDLERQRPLAYGRGSEHGVQALAFSPDGTTLASGGRGQPKLWDVAGGRLLLEFALQ